MSWNTPLRQVTDGLKKFDNDEEGMETVQVVILLGLASLVAAVIFLFWKEIQIWFNKRKKDWKNNSELSPE